MVESSSGYSYARIVREISSLVMQANTSLHQVSFLSSAREAYSEVESDSPNQEGRVLGLAMVPGQHVVSVKVESIN